MPHAWCMEAACLSVSCVIFVLCAVVLEAQSVGLAARRLFRAPLGLAASCGLPHARWLSAFMVWRHTHRVCCASQHTMLYGVGWVLQSKVHGMHKWVLLCRAPSCRLCFSQPPLGGAVCPTYPLVGLIVGLFLAVLRPFPWRLTWCWFVSFCR